MEVSKVRLDVFAHGAAGGIGIAGFNRGEDFGMMLMGDFRAVTPQRPPTTLFSRNNPRHPKVKLDQYRNANK